MEDIQRKLEKEIAALSLPKPPKKIRRWTFLVVGDHGKTITIRWFRGLAIIWALVLMLAIAIAGGLYFLYKDTNAANISLRQSLEDVRQQVFSARSAKDIFMARLVIAESEIEKLRANLQAMSAEENPVGRSQGRLENKTNPDETADNKSEIFVERQPEKLATDTEPQTPERVEIYQSVTVEEFNVSHEQESNTFRAQFKLRNTSPDSNPVSGYTSVILKNIDTQQDNWLSLPLVRLISGKPAGKKRGQYFSIARFKTVKFRVKSKFDPALFNMATVFVFDASKNLLLEKDFPIDIQTVVSTTID